MALTPDDIERRTFRVVRKGYDREEVDGFLLHVAAELRALSATPAGPGELGTGPAFVRVAHTIASMLQTAAESAAGIRRDAEAEADALRRQAGEELERARADAARLVEEARRQADDVRRQAADDHERLTAIDRDLRGRLEEAAEMLFRSLHRPVVNDPLSLPVISFPDEERLSR